LKGKNNESPEESEKVSIPLLARSRLKDHGRHRNSLDLKVSIPLLARSRLKDSTASQGGTVSIPFPGRGELRGSSSLCTSIDSLQ
jgi:hypothetical protein